MVGIDLYEGSIFACKRSLWSLQFIIALSAMIATICIVCIAIPLTIFIALRNREDWEDS